MLDFRPDSTENVNEYQDIAVVSYAATDFFELTGCNV
jgi:hypothetical protein